MVFSGIVLALAALGAAAPPARDGGRAGGSESGGPRPPLGFFAEGRKDQAKAEAAFLATPTPERVRAWLRALTEEPHVAGTAEGKRSAEYVRDRLVEFGLKAELNSYEVLLNHPKSVALR